MIVWLDDNAFPQFPPTSQALTDPNGLLAAGGGISPLWLETAYRHGIFPWHNPDEPRLWWSPAPRAIITPDSFRIPRTVRKLLNKPHRITSNQAFRQVMEACAGPRDGASGTWINKEMIDSYTALHSTGRAISVEYWNAAGELSGGFYGVLIGRAFFGESMFSKVDNASKIAFAKAAPYLFRYGVELIDCQMRTDHLAQFGLIELDRPEFETLLNKATNAAAILPLPVNLI